MKRRHGFVSNSSSSAFIIVNNTSRPKTLVDFLDDNPELWERYWTDHKEDVLACGRDWYGFTEAELKKQNLLQSAATHHKLLMPGENYIILHDDAHILHETILHSVLENVMPSHPEWSWRFKESFH